MASFRKITTRKGATRWQSRWRVPGTNGRLQDRSQNFATQKEAKAHAGRMREIESRGDGDPRGDGEGGPGYTIRDELNELPYLRGTVGMALDWKDTGGSQFFITHAPQPHLDGRYTVMGYVVNGMDVVDRLVPGDVIRRVRVSDGVID